MSAKHLIWVLTSASLLSPTSVNVVRAQAEKHADHGIVRGPLPEAVRESTERYRDVNDAIAAGYAQNAGCVSGPQEGAMGVHFVKLSLFDGTIDVENPEVLVYEPRNGRLHLVAAEFVVPAAAWNPASDPSGVPNVMGHLYHFVSGPNRYGADAFYELHVWAWKDNPHGSFADWNPKVTCAQWGGTMF